MGFFTTLMRLFMPAATVRGIHRVGPGEFLDRLRDAKPAELTVERLTDANDRAQWRFSFTDDRLEEGSWRSDKYVIYFSVEFVPPAFRRFCDRARWQVGGQFEESVWFDQRGRVKNPHRALPR